MCMVGSRRLPNVPCFRKSGQTLWPVLRTYKSWWFWNTLALFEYHTIRSYGKYLHFEPRLLYCGVWCKLAIFQLQTYSRASETPKLDSVGRFKAEKWLEIFSWWPEAEKRRNSVLVRVFHKFWHCFNMFSRVSFVIQIFFFSPVLYQ